MILAPPVAHTNVTDPNKLTRLQTSQPPPRHTWKTGFTLRKSINQTQLTPPPATANLSSPPCLPLSPLDTAFYTYPEINTYNEQKLCHGTNHGHRNSKQDKIAESGRGHTLVDSNIIEELDRLRRTDKIGPDRQRRYGRSARTLRQIAGIGETRGMERTKCQTRCRAENVL